MASRERGSLGGIVVLGTGERPLIDLPVFVPGGDRPREGRAPERLAALTLALAAQAAANAGEAPSSIQLALDRGALTARMALHVSRDVGTNSLALARMSDDNFLRRARYAQLVSNLIAFGNTVRVTGSMEHSSGAITRTDTTFSRESPGKKYLPQVVRTELSSARGPISGVVHEVQCTGLVSMAKLRTFPPVPDQDTGQARPSADPALAAIPLRMEGELLMDGLGRIDGIRDEAVDLLAGPAAVAVDVAYHIS